MSFEFLVTSFIIIVIPGTGALYTVAAGLTRGPQASVVAALACTLGIVPHIVAAISGLAALLNASAAVFQIIKYIGVAYLLYMAVMLLRDKGTLKVDAGTRARPRHRIAGRHRAYTAATSAAQVIKTGILINILNPKLTIFFFAFLPQFVRPGTHDATLQMIGLSLVFMLVTFVVFVAYGMFAAAFRDHIVERPKAATVMRRTFAGMFATLAGILAFSDL